VVASDRMRGNGHKLKHRRCPLNTRKHFLPVRVTEHLHSFTRDVVETQTLKIFRSHLDTGLIK